MTERFMVDDYGTLIDMETRDMYELAYEVVDCLNALHEENTHLKKQLNCIMNSLQKELYNYRSLYD